MDFFKKHIGTMVVVVLVIVALTFAARRAPAVRSFIGLS